MDENTLMRILDGVEFCSVASGVYYRATAVTLESTGPVVLLEEAPNE
ncbi:MAG: hypothetical protein AAGU32_14075 [Bacillota bacterium]